MANRFADMDTSDDSSVTKNRFADIDTPETPAAPKAPEQPSYTDILKRYTGLLGRDVVEGATALPTAIANIPAAGANLTRWAGDKALGIPPSSPSVGYVDPYSEGMTKLGAPQPNTTGERLAGDAIKAASGAGSQIKLGQQGANILGSKLAKLLAANPGVQTAGAVTGGLAGGGARELGANPIVQFLASLVGGAAPVGVANIPNATKAILRGGASPQKIADNIANFKAAGSFPSIGQATEGRAARALETGLSKVPGGAGVMQKAAEKQAGDIGGAIENIASGLSGRTDPTITGRAIEKGVTESFIPEARKTQTKLYNELDSFLPPQKEISIGNFTKAMGKLNEPIKGAENLSKTQLFLNNTIKEIQSGLEKDLGGEPAKPSVILDAMGKPLVTPAVPPKTTMPYSAIKQLRTRIGEKIEQYDLSPEISKTELKRLYGALSEDMKSAAKAAGPKAEAAFDRANKYTKTLHNRIDILQGVLDKKGGYENVFKQAMANTSEGATTLNAVMKALPPEGKKAFTSTVLRRMGRANLGDQNDIGDVFSTEKFLTNWNKLDSRAKTALFGNQSKQFNDDIQKISKVASNLRDGSKVFKNPSGTASQGTLLAAGGELGTGIMAAITGQPLVLGTAIAAMAVPNIAARAVTNPNFVHWLAQNSTKPASAYPVALNQLAQIASQKDDSDLKDIVDELKQSAPKPKPTPYTKQPFDNFLQQANP